MIVNYLGVNNNNNCKGRDLQDKIMGSWSRVRLRFTRDLVVEFIDRDVSLKHIEDFAEKGTGYPVVVYGPEGCGKTALFRQAMEVLRSYGYSVIYVSPLEHGVEDRLITTKDIKDLASTVLSMVVSESLVKLVNAAIELAVRALRRSRRVAIIADDIFQAVGMDKAEVYTKMFLNMIEYPPVDYERIVVLISSSEGVTRSRIGRHNWAWIKSLWNMPKNGFKQLYNQIPYIKPSFEEVWRFTGGNPRYLRELYLSDWRSEVVIDDLFRRKRLRDFINRLTGFQRRVLEEALIDPDALFETLGEVELKAKKNEISTLIDSLIELNMIEYDLADRKEHLWIDVPPPEKDLELGIGKYVAWQTPLHREAMKRALRELEK